MEFNVELMRVAITGLMWMCSHRGPRRKPAVMHTFLLALKIPDIRACTSVRVFVIAPVANANNNCRQA